jgi:hypothetical protein
MAAAGVSLVRKGALRTRNTGIYLKLLGFIFNNFS